MLNSLLKETALPPFDEFTPEQVEPAITHLIESNLSAINELLEKNDLPTWQNLIEPMEALEDKLNKAWSIVSHLNSVMSTPLLREVHNRCLPLLSEYATTIGQNEKLYSAYRMIKESKAFATFSIAQQKVITNALRDFTLSGVALEKNKREEFAELQKTLSQLQTKFQDNLMDATDAWYLDIVAIEELSGLSEQTIEAAKLAAQKANVSGWRLTLDFPCYQAVITYADDAKLRQKIHEAYLTRGSELQNSKWDNSQLMIQILATRHKMATLLNFEHYAARSLATKMAKTPEEVLAFLENLAQKTKPHAEQEFKALQAFAEEYYQVSQLAPWDIAYYSEKLRQKNYAISQETLRPYFPLPKVISGMFEVVKRIYGLHIEEKKDVPVWHQDVHFYEIKDENHHLRGMFYLDVFARNQKRGGAWMDEARVRRKALNQSLQYPIAFLTCNFRAPVNDEPSLLTHEEVLTLFHEFGHGLHHMLTKIEEPSVSGINGVPWDAVELPSQFMENWCWQIEALAFISGHYQTNESLPTALLDKMQQAKNFQIGMMLLRQLEFSLFDFRLHLEFSLNKPLLIQTILDEVRAKYSVVPVAPYNRFAHSFSHIFAGGYAAGYYSYLWAEVLACDAFSKFEETGIFNKNTGLAFMENILEKGGSEEPAVLFKAFRGKEVDLMPFLRQHGLKPAAVQGMKD